MRRPIIYFLAAIVIFGGLAVAWYLASPLFINRTVDEPFPVDVPPPNELAEMSEEELRELEAAYMEALPPEKDIAQMPEQERKDLEDKAMQISAAMPDKEMDEPIPVATSTPQITPTAPHEPVLVAEGDFHGADDFHQGSGDALIYQNPDGSYFLRLENFEVTNGPQLHIILGVEDNPSDHAALGDYLDLGPLKGNIGDQNYLIPENTDLNTYSSVVIYCVPFRVIFAIAPLE